jgi:hypothetical protein
MSTPKTSVPSILNDKPLPKPGDQVIDVSDMVLVDITPEHISKLVKLHDGADKAMANIERLKPAEIERAGLNEKDVTRALGLIAEHRRLEGILPAAEKLVELIFENKLDRGHQIGLLLGEIATQARRRGERDPKGAEILGPLADLFEYQYGPANKAVATRERNAKAAKTSPTPDSSKSTPTL